MIAYRCLNCGCIHGWYDHPQIAKVKKHTRGAWEDIWHCPKCNAQLRTNDGTVFGQLQKRWEEITNVEEALRQEREPFEVRGGRLYYRHWDHDEFIK